MTDPIPEDELERYEKRRPQQVVKDGLAFVPDKPTKFWVGEETWHKDESKFVVTRGKDWPESVIVSCLDDPQIIFPGAERWRQRTAWDVIGATEHTIPMSDERLAELRWHIRRMTVYRVDNDFWAALDAAKELIAEVDRLRKTPEETKASMRIDGS